MRQILHISIHFDGEVDYEGLKKEFDRAIDWIHYMPNCWLVLTSSDSDRWWMRLYPLLGDNAMLLIVPIDAKNARGWIYQWVIDWIEQAEKRLTEPVSLPLPPGMTRKQLPPKPSSS